MSLSESPKSPKKKIDQQSIDPSVATTGDQVRKHIQSAFSASLPPPPPPPPMKKSGSIESETSSSTLTEAFTHFALLDQCKDGVSYSDIRDQLADASYVELLDHEDEYNKVVDQLDREQASNHNMFSDAKDFRQYAFDAANTVMTHGQLKNKNAESTAHGGFQLNYNDVEKLDPDKPMTTFWINPSINDLPEVLNMIDLALQESNAQVKIYVDGFTDIENPEDRPSDKVVVYFNADDHASIDQFLKKLSAEGDELKQCLKPEPFERVMSTLRVPICPGITFVERPTGNSWDTTYFYLFKEQMNVLQTVWRNWREKSIKPDKKQYRMLLRTIDSSRNKKMPGLRAS